MFLSDKLKELGFRIQRLKTGTPPRVEMNSVDYSKTQIQPGTDEPLAFSYDTTTYIPIENQTTYFILHIQMKKLIRLLKIIYIDLVCIRVLSKELVQDIALL